MKKAQVQSMDELCKLLFKKVIISYNTHFNPLGIADDTTLEINKFKFEENSSIEEIYENLAAVYRYQYGDCQLQIIWDGKSQLDKFNEDWTQMYAEWVNSLCVNKSFIKGILQLTVFNQTNKNSFFVENHLKGIINEYFELKVLVKNGVKRVYVKMPNISKAS